MRTRKLFVALAVVSLTAIGQFACTEITDVTTPRASADAQRVDSLRRAVNQLVSRSMSTGDSATLAALRSELSAVAGSAAARVAANGPRLSLSLDATASSAAQCTVTSFGTSAGCPVTVALTPTSPQPLLQSSYPTRVQEAPIHGVFSAPVRGVAVSGSGAILCSGTFGTLIGYDSAGAEVARTALQLIDPSDCGADDVTFGAQGSLNTTKPIKSFTIEPPQPWDFPVLGNPGGHATAYYTLTFTIGGPKVVIDYEDGTPIVSEGTGSAPLILPADVARPTDISRAGAPPRYGTGYWPDSLVIDAGVDSSGSRAAGRDISLYLRAVDEGGASIDGEYGHLHHSTAGATKSPGVLSVATVTTDDAGHSRAVFRPIKISGPVVLVATSADADSAVDTIRVGVPGLQSLSATTSSDLVGATTIHPDAHWVTIEMGAKLREFADSFHVATDSLAHFNDASLRFGGKFDLHEQWGEPDQQCTFRPEGQPSRVLPDGCHSRHRIGRDIDLRTRGFTQTRYKALVIRLWTQIAGIGPVREADHLHLAYRR